MGIPTDRPDESQIAPLKLKERMKIRHITQTELADLSGYSKQLLSKILKGERTLTRDVAKALAPHLGVEWPELYGYELVRREGTEDRKKVLISIGKRLAWARGYRKMGLSEAARRLAMEEARLAKIEAGEEELTLFEILTIAPRLGLPLDYILLGADGSLPHDVALALQQDT